MALNPIPTTIRLLSQQRCVATHRLDTQSMHPVFFFFPQESECISDALNVVPEDFNHLPKAIALALTKHQPHKAITKKMKLKLCTKTTM